MYNALYTVLVCLVTVYMPNVYTNMWLIRIWVRMCVSGKNTAEISQKSLFDTKKNDALDTSTKSYITHIHMACGKCGRDG